MDCVLREHGQAITRAGGDNNQPMIEHRVK